MDITVEKYEYITYFVVFPVLLKLLKRHLYNFESFQRRQRIMLSYYYNRKIMFSPHAM